MSENKSAMYKTLKRLYDEGRLTVQGLRNAVTKGWITEEDMKEIMGIVDEKEEPVIEDEEE